MLVASDLVKHYGPVQVLKGVSLSVANGEIVSIVGASGAGKSTLLQLLGTLDKADGGTISINGNVVAGLYGNSLARFRNKHIGFVFQAHNLLPEFSALENVCIPAYIGGASRAVAERKATELLQKLGLGHRLDHKPMMMSGGEQQRVAVARALVNSPSVVYADEPSGNLDTQNAEALHQLFFDLRAEMGQTFVIVTHNQQLANRADRCLRMEGGVIVNGS